jgi:hypothetical protein
MRTQNTIFNTIDEFQAFKFVIDTERASKLTSSICSDLVSAVNTGFESQNAVTQLL